LVTEIMDCNLRQKLYRKGLSRLSAEQVSVISLDVAHALNYLHQKPTPIVHRDINSANVLLWQKGKQWRAKVSDYGTANFVRQSTTSDPGTAIYCAPEFWHEVPDQPISCKVDVYSFGVLLCEMCIRRLPEPEYRDRQIAQMKNRKYRDLVTRCVQREPGARPNMDLIIQEL